MDLPTIFQTLDKHRVRYFLVGALGAVAHGAHLHTSDVDICNATDEENSRRIHAALLELGAVPVRKPPERSLEDVDISRWETLRLDDPSEHHLFGTAYGQIDVLPNPLGRDGWNSLTCYDELVEGSVELYAFGVRIRVAAFEFIAASKLSAGRPQDIESGAELERVGAMLARGERPDYGLEQYASEVHENWD